MNDIIMQYDKVQTKIALAKGKDCDKYDYLIAVFCGAIAGMVDIIFLGKPNVKDISNSRLGSWTDLQSEKLITGIADRQIAKDLYTFNQLKESGLKGEALREALEQSGAPRNFNKNGYPSFKDKITYLENKYRVSYDQSTVAEFNNIGGKLSGLTPSNHHIKSLAHCPDIIGLGCSIIDQFTGETSFFQGGKIIHVVPTKLGPELRGTTLISKLYCAFCNWMGHLLSDFCGSHSSKGRGMGIPIPFFEMLQICDFGDFPNMASSSNGSMTFAELSVKVFENGYDARFGLAMAIPVLLNDLIIRFLWALKQRFYHKKNWSECVPDNKHKTLRLMLIVGNGTLCVFDGMDATIRSKGNWLEFFLHINIIAWFKLVVRVCKEIMIRFDFTYEDLRIQFEYLNYQLQIYIERLKEIDYAAYQKQFEELDDIAFLLEKDIEEANDAMSEYIQEHGIETSFDDFDRFLDLMNDPDSIIKF